MKRIAVGKHGIFALVDDRDYDELSKTKWSLKTVPDSTRQYATRIDRETFKTISMHRQIMGFPQGLDVDHHDGDGLNNQRSNLRSCSRSENMRNGTHRRNNNTSGFIGVSWHTAAKKWEACIKNDYGKIYLGVFDSPEMAARARDAKAIEVHGEYAKLNFP